MGKLQRLLIILGLLLVLSCISTEPIFSESTSSSSSSSAPYSSSSAPNSSFSKYIIPLVLENDSFPSSSSSFPPSSSSSSSSSSSPSSYSSSSSSPFSSSSSSPPRTSDTSSTAELVSRYLQNNSLSSLASLASGVYKDPVKSQQLHLGKTLILTVTNRGFLNIFHNFNCYMDRMGFKYLTVALELHSHYYLNTHGFLSYYLDHNSSAAFVEDDVGESAAGFGSNLFKTVTYRKIRAVYELLELGYDVVFTDTDIAYLNDPMPYLLFQNVDLVHSYNGMCNNGSSYEPTFDYVYGDKKGDGNTGFYFVRSTNSTKIFYRRVLSAIPESPEYDDQTIFWSEARKTQVNKVVHIKVLVEGCHDYSKNELEKTKASQSNNEEVMVICPLDTCQFTSGGLGRHGFRRESLLHILETLNTSSRYQNMSQPPAKLITVHANFLNNGNVEKYLRFYENGLWYANPGTHENDDNFNNFFNVHKRPNTPQISDTWVTRDRRYYDGACSTFQPIFGVGGGTGIHIPDGLLVKLWGGGPSTYIIENNTKRDIYDLHTFLALGRDFSECFPLGENDWNAIPTGEVLVIK